MPLPVCLQCQRLRVRAAVLGVLGCRITPGRETRVGMLSGYRAAELLGIPSDPVQLVNLETVQPDVS